MLLHNIVHRINCCSFEKFPTLFKKQRLVHSLLAEQLNSSNYKLRAAVCNVLCQTRGDINHDLVNKLKKMMSQDWSSQVS